MSKRTTRAGASFAASLISLFSLSYFNLSRSDDTADTSTTKGPGAALKCASSGKNAYDTFGAAAFALRPIAIGEEITYDYAFPPDLAEPCQCGSSNCRGLIMEEDALPIRGAVAR